MPEPKVAAKKWTGWFKPVGRGQRSGELIVVPIKVSGDRPRTKLVITVPSSCGNAVKRNRFRRLVRECYRELLVGRFKGSALAQKAVWIRLQNQCRLENKLPVQKIKAELTSLLEKLV